MTWDLLCYHDQNGQCDICDWYNALPSNDKGRWDNVFKYLKAAPRDKWVRPQVGVLHGPTCNDLYEARFKFGRVQHRPIFFFGPNQNQVTFLIYAKEVGGKLIPRNACQSASSVMANIKNNPSRIHKCPF